MTADPGYADALQARLEELYPGADVEVQIVDATGSSRAPRVVGGGADDEDTIGRVIQDVWDEGAFWSDG